MYLLDFGNCNCDLTRTICDINCCCDSDCSSDDKNAFKCKVNPYYRYNIQEYNRFILLIEKFKYSFSLSYYSKFWCVPSSSLFTQNTPYIVNSFTDLVCVDSNNCKNQFFNLFAYNFSKYYFPQRAHSTIIWHLWSIM